MRIRYYVIIILIIGASFVNAQTPTVTEKFDHLYISENFDSSNSYWTTLSNAENLLIVQEGEYIMQRKATVSPYAVMSNFNTDLPSYRLVTSLKLDKTSATDGSIGLIFMAQADGKGGFIFEITKDQKYRLRQIQGNTYRYLTGTAADGGWHKNEAIKGLNLPNLVDIRTVERKYDLFINNVLIKSFAEPAYKSGGIGFIIGPGSKGKADFIYLFTKGQENITREDVANADSSGTPETDIIALAESIIALKTQINKLQEENDDLKGIINDMKSDDKAVESEKSNYEKKILGLEVQLKKSNAVTDSLLKANNELMKYKEMVKGVDNGDIVINLSKNLKNEKLINDELRKANKQLLDSIAALKSQAKLKPKATSIANPNNNDTIKPSNEQHKEEFVLPKEN